MDNTLAPPDRDRQRVWWPVAPSGDVRADRPLARMLSGVPLVLFRDIRGNVAALHDRCPHRHAPLSAGRVCAGEVRCPYHGWRFDAAGRCTAVPGMAFQPAKTPLVTTLSSREAHGLVWVCTTQALPDEGPVPPSVIDGVDVFFMSERVRSGLAEAAENFLDGFHTHFVHAGWIRHDAKRQRVHASVRRLSNGIEATYRGEGLQSGLVSRWLEGSRSESFGRFRWPGVAEIEYRGETGLNLLITAWLTPEDAQHLRVHARVATPRGFWPSWLKRIVLRRLFGAVLQQDKSILEQTADNARRFAQAGLLPRELHTPLDLLGPSIRALLNGEEPDLTAERDLVVSL